MGLPRACLLAVLVAAGSASVAPLAAQDPAPIDPSVSMLPPRALPLPTLPLVPNPGDMAQPPGYVPAAMLAQPSAAPDGSQTAGLGAPTDAQSTADGGQLPQPRVAPGAAAATRWQPFPTAAPAPNPAPAWRWHGYGAVNPGDVSALTPPAGPTTTPATQPSPPAAPAAPQPMPTGSPAAPVLPDTTGWRQPGAVPVEAPAVTLSSALEPAWRSAGTRVAAAPTNPMRAVPNAPEPWVAAAPRHPNTNATAVAFAAPDARWTGPSAALSAPRPMPAGSYTPRAVSSDSPPDFNNAGQTVRPVSYAYPTTSPWPTSPTPPPAVRTPAASPAPRPVAPPPAVTAVPTLVALRSSIERACYGRGYNLEVYARGPASLLVRVKVRQAADAEYLANRISQLPELRPYQILYEMQVAR
jgi:hypothetical protein